MKIFLTILLSVLLCGCTDLPTENTTTNESDNMHTVCQYISGEITGGVNGWYELMRHSDGTSDVLHTNIFTGTRSTFGEHSTFNTPYGSLAGIFTTDKFMYMYFYGFPETMNKEENSSAIYQYDYDGNIIQMVYFDKNIKFGLNSAVVCDSEYLYLQGYNGSNSVIYRLSEADLKAEIIYQCDEQLSLVAGYKNQLVVFATDEKSKTMETVNIDTLQRTVLFETKFPWYMLDSGTLYSYRNQPGVLETYDLKDNTTQSIKIFDKDDCVNSWQIPYGAIQNRYLTVFTSQYQGNCEKSYIYDLSENKLTEVNNFYGKTVPAVIDSTVWFIAPVGEERIYLNNGFTVRIDHNYIITSLEDLISQKDAQTTVTNEINYR